MNLNFSDQEKAISVRTTPRTVTFTNSASTRTIPSVNPRPRLRALEKYQLILLAWDVLCNLTVDCSSSNPLTVLILFVLQCVPLVINLVLCGVSAANYALQYGVDRKLIIRYHEVNLGSMLTYLVLTFWWYIWTVRRLWPSVGDHFNFSSSDYYSNNNDTAQDGGNRDWDELTGTVPREYYTLWSPGFIALYTIQRTVAVIYYVVGIKSVYVLQNEPEMELTADFHSEHEEDNVLPDSGMENDPEPVIYGYGRNPGGGDRGLTTISELMSRTLDQYPYGPKMGGRTPSEKSRSRNSSATVVSTRSRQQPQQSSRRSSKQVHEKSPSRSSQRLRFENQSSQDESSFSSSVTQQKEYITLDPESRRRHHDSRY